MNSKYSFSIASLFFIMIFSFLTFNAQAQEFYKLKIYSFTSDEQVKTTDNYLQNAYLPALKKLGLKNIGVFKLRPTEKDSSLKTFVLIPFNSLDRIADLDDKLLMDNSYLENGKEYLNGNNDNPPYARVEVIISKAFSDMPVMKPSALNGPRNERIYELRSYESSTESLFKNKVDMFNSGGEVKLFDKLGFNAVYYSEVISGSHMPNLMYMTTHANQESRDNNWKAFSDAPEWIALKALPKYQKNVSHIDIFFLYPTEYSDY